MRNLEGGFHEYVHKRSFSQCEARKKCTHFSSFFQSRCRFLRLYVLLKTSSQISYILSIMLVLKEEKFQFRGIKMSGGIWRKIKARRKMK